MKKTLLIGALALIMPFAAFADGGPDCANPLPLESLSSDGGTTCGGQIGINMGGIIFGSPSKIYSVHINNSGPGGPLTDMQFTGTDVVAVLTQSCTVAPIAFGGTGLPLDLAGTPDGDYLLVVSIDPSINPTVPPTCTDFGITAGVLPVSLQNFSVE